MTLRRSLVQGLRVILAWPGECYAGLYVSCRLNRVLHRLGLSGAAQLRFVPSRLRATCALLRQPYRVPLQALRWGGRPSGGELRRGSGHGCGLVFDGDWDIEDKRAIDDYLGDYIYSRTVIEYLGRGLAYQETAQYAEMRSLVESGRSSEWQARGCTTMAEVDGYFKAMRDTFGQMRCTGYRTQVELGEPDRFNEIKVFVGRDGELLKHQGAGHHRLAMARLLDVPDIPVLVMGVHRDWALRCFDIEGQDIITSIDLALRRLTV